jgi:hypothetical protein
MSVSSNAPTPDSSSSEFAEPASSTQSEPDSLATSTTSVASSTASSSDASSAPIVPLLSPSPQAGANALGEFNSSTLTIDFAWQAPANASGAVAYSISDLGSSSAVANAVPLWSGTSTQLSEPAAADGSTHWFALAATDESGRSSTATTSVALPNWLAVVQPQAEAVSEPSWYSDTWYELGTGFYGTLRELTLYGAVTPAPYFASHLSLDEFLDAGYTQKSQTFVLSDNAPFTGEMGPVTIKGLHVPLQPNKYYRLGGYNEYQNRSIVLKGTNATSTAMASSFVPGVGRVETRYPFYPYLAWTFIPQWPPLAAPNPPTGFNIVFDPGGPALNLAWGPATDPDTPSALLTYEYAVSTSTALAGVAWQAVGQNFSARVPVAYPNTYLVGVRARDDLGNISEPVGVSWGFPAGYDPAHPWRGTVFSAATLPTSTIEYGSNWNFFSVSTPLGNFPSSFSDNLFLKLYVQDVYNPWNNTSYAFPLIGWNCGGYGCGGDGHTPFISHSPVAYYLAPAPSTPLPGTMQNGTYNQYVVVEFDNVQASSPIYLSFYGGGAAHFWGAGVSGNSVFYCAATTLQEAWNCPLGP